MKTFFSLLLFASISITTVSAQASTAQPFSTDVVTAPKQQTGSGNYLISLKDEDFKTKKYIAYTDSNARVAYIQVNGSPVRLTGGPNAEHIMAYTSKNYTLTISITKKLPMAKSEDSDDRTSTKIEGLINISDSKGRTIVTKFTGSVTTAVKN